jgi:hypothetical protein
MNCADLRERSFDYLYDLLDPQERAALEAHLRDCPACGELLRTAAAQRSLLRDAAPVPGGLADRTVVRLSSRPRWWRVAAAAVLLLGVGFAPLLSALPSGIVWAGADGRRIVAPGGEVGDGVVEYPDGSRATLSSRSRARVAARGLTLDAGEAAFRVAPARERFVVHTPAADVTVVGTEFQVRLLGEEPMNRKSLAAGSGVLLTVAVVTGIVSVSNDRGEVLLRADETASVRPGEAPRRITEADLERVARETRQAEEEATALEAQSTELRRAGKAILLELQRQPAPGQAPKKQSPDAFMKAQMSAAVKSLVTMEVDKIDRRVHLTPEQRKAFQASFEKMFQGAFDLFASGDIDKFSEPQDPALEPALLATLTPEQAAAYKQMRDEEAEREEKVERLARKKEFDGAADAAKLTETQRAALEADLTRILMETRKESAKLTLKALSGKLTPENLEGERAGVVQRALDPLKDRLTPEQTEALRTHLQKQFQTATLRLGDPSKESDR